MPYESEINYVDLPSPLLTHVNKKTRSMDTDTSLLIVLVVFVVLSFLVLLDMYRKVNALYFVSTPPCPKLPARTFQSFLP